MIERVTPRTASGFAEYLPEDQIQLNQMLDVIRCTYEKYGFSPIDTPILELSEVLLTKSGGDTEKEVYRFQKGRNDFCMRYDLTVPLARYAAQHFSSLVFPFRRYHIGKVYRAERAQAGRFREFYQCDIDLIGSDSKRADSEFPLVIEDIFNKLCIGEFTVYINNRKLINGFMQHLGCNDSSESILRIIDKRKKISESEFRNELSSAIGCENKLDALMKFCNVKGSHDDQISTLKEMSDNATFQEGVKELEDVVRGLRQGGMQDSRFGIDTSIVRGLDYYTGVIYETFLNNHPEVGSICSGGRYDNLVEHYSSQSLTGIGISIGLSRLFYKLKELGLIDSGRRSPSRVAVMPVSDSELDYERSLSVASRLRDSGISVMLYTESVSMKKKMRYADRMGFNFVVLSGEQESQTDSYSVKNMQSGETRSSSVDEIIRQIS